MVAVTNDPVRVATFLFVEGDEAGIFADMQTDGGVVQPVLRLGQHVQDVNGEATRLPAHKKGLPVLAHELWRQVDECRSAGG